MIITKEVVENYLKQIEELPENNEKNMLITDCWRVAHTSKYDRLPRTNNLINNDVVSFIKNAVLTDKNDLDKLKKIIDYYNINQLKVDLNDKLLYKLSDEIKNYEETPQNKKLIKEMFRLAFPYGTCSSKYDVLKRDIIHIFMEYLKLSKEEPKEENTFNKDRLLVSKKIIKLFMYYSEQLMEEKLKKEAKGLKKEKPKKQVSTELGM